MLNARIETYGHNPVVGDIVLNDKCVTILTQNTLKTYTMHDIVLPMPAADTIYPKNLMDGTYKRFMAGLGINDERMAHAEQLFFSLLLTLRAYCVDGSYQSIVGKVHDASYKFVRYNKDKDVLLQNDIDAISNKKVEVFENGQLIALKLTFSVCANHYASMALREFMKCNE